MCRLLGLNAGRRQATARFWLLDAPDSLLAESRRNPDGTGLGWFGTDGRPRIDKQAEPAFEDPAFERAAREVTSTTIVSHVRHATTGAHTLANTHPFEMAGRLMAHNGGFGDLPSIEARLGDDLALVRGDTDSERFFALITKETRERDGDVGAGIAAAAEWIAGHLPMYSLNCVIVEPGRMWALRYPDQRALHVLATTGLTGGSASQQVRAAEVPLVVVASERLDDDPGWRMLDPGELLAVDAGLGITSRIAVAGPPRRLQGPAGPDPNIDS